MGLEEVAGYEDYFSPQEWLAILSDDWSLLDEDEEVAF